jgi:thiol-disulfide isomerase/thioredoxin
MRLLVLVALAACHTPPRKLDWTPAPPTGEVAELVRSELGRAKRDGRRLVVYVGATWCEPCRRFHDAAASGQLDKEFGALRFLEFDFDRDAGRLQAAGYVSRLIPLFAAPGADGRASGRQIEGSVKGEAAVGEIAPRLLALLRDQTAL